MENRSHAQLRSLRWIALAGLLASSASAEPPADAKRSAPKYAEYAGYYASGSLLVGRIFAVDDALAAQPPFWTSKPYFERADGETLLASLVLSGYAGTHQVVKQEPVVETGAGIQWRLETGG